MEVEKVFNKLNFEAFNKNVLHLNSENLISVSFAYKTSSKQIEWEFSHWLEKSEQAFSQFTLFWEKASPMNLQSAKIKIRPTAISRKLICFIAFFIDAKVREKNDITNNDKLI